MNALLAQEAREFIAGVEVTEREFLDRDSAKAFIAKWLAGDELTLEVA